MEQAQWLPQVGNIEGRHMRVLRLKAGHVEVSVAFRGW